MMMGGAVAHTKGARVIAVPAQQTSIPFGDYFLLKRIAVGGMAELFLAEDPRKQKRIVIKRILPYLANEPEFVQMFLDEARIAAQLHHPNVVEVNELGKLGDHIFIAMEFVDGIDLRRMLQQEQKRQATIPFTIGAHIVARICEGLHYAHNRVGLDGKPLNLIHRDISPQNVMVSFTGDVKLVDFGIAKASAVVERSKPGVIKGKYLYLAPEQLSQEKLDHRADLFAVGTMLYEITTGKSPFAKTTTEAVILSIRNEDPPPPHLVRQDFPLELSRIITKCLQKDRNRRYQQAGEIQEELDDYVQSVLPTDKAALKTYVARLFGTEEDRTVLSLPQRPESKPVRKDEDGETMDTTASTQSDRGERSKPGPPIDEVRPTAKLPGPQAGDDYEPKTMTARPEDLERAFTPSGLQPTPQRRASGAHLMAAGKGDPERTQMADEQTGVTGPNSAPSQPTPQTTSGRGVPHSRITTPTQTPVGAFSQEPPTRDSRRPSNGGNNRVIEPPPELPAEPSTSRERRKSTAQPSKPTMSRPPNATPPGDRDDDESTADFRLSRVLKAPPWLDSERTAMIAALGLLLLGVIALTALIVQRIRHRNDLATVPPPIEEPVHKPSPHTKVDPKPKEPPVEVKKETPPIGDQTKTEPKTVTEDAAKPDAGVAVAATETHEDTEPHETAHETTHAPVKTPVVFKAPAGTQIKVNKKEAVPGKQYRYPSGSLKYTYRCPQRGSRVETRSERLPATRGIIVIPIKCSK